MSTHSSKSLEEIHSSVNTSNQKGFLRKLFAFMGPAYLVSVGYMDPGNWATDIAAGSSYGYSLIWVLLMSNLMALLLQSLSTRLGIAGGMDLAQASKDNYSRPINLALYFLAEIAIAATDLAEVLGMAIGLQLLFGFPLLWGVLFTFLDTLLLLLLIQWGMRTMEAFIVALVLIIGLAFGVQLWIAQPNLHEVALGFIPSIPDERALYIAIGIIGATVMPHNLYLHSSLVQSRKFLKDNKSIKSALRFNFIDSAIALNFAFFVNSSILILAAATFYKSGYHEISVIQDAHKLLSPLLGSTLAPMLFAIALIAAGQSSTITGTLAGQIVMEGYLNLRIQPWVRRIITRALAIIPAVIVILFSGEETTGEMLIFSQVVLSLQLGFAIIPLIHFVSNPQIVGKFAISFWVQFLAWTCAFIIVSLNAKLVIDQVQTWYLEDSSSIWLWLLVFPLIILAFLLLLYVTFEPYIRKKSTKEAVNLHSEATELPKFHAQEFKKICIAIDYSKMDSQIIESALSIGKKDAEYVLIHVVESVGALILGDEIKDRESKEDKQRLLYYRDNLIENGYNATIKLGFGRPKKVIPEIVKSQKADLLVMGAHGHKFFKDLIFGTTVESVRHAVKIPVFVIRDSAIHTA